MGRGCGRNRAGAPLTGDLQAEAVVGRAEDVGGDADEDALVGAQQLREHQLAVLLHIEPRVGQHRPTRLRERSEPT